MEILHIEKIIFSQDQNAKDVFFTLTVSEIGKETDPKESWLLIRSTYVELAYFPLFMVFKI